MEQPSNQSLPGDDRHWPTLPQIVLLGDSALLVRFGQSLDDAANRAALVFAARLEADGIVGVVEIVPSLVSVLVRYDPAQVGVARLSGELALRLSGDGAFGESRTHRIAVRFDGPDIGEVAALLGLSIDGFVEAHNRGGMRVLATGFAPGFVYCGFHEQALAVPRRTLVRPQVSAGSVLFAAGQTAIAATDIPTGWHVIGHTQFRNFDPTVNPPTQLRAGDQIIFEVVL
ncbi:MULTISPECIES: 5-oxoprolinase subunit B family protein [Devosia]|uniref:5-oxoprolinase subunit B family protein n=1 Tax=Devosia TaxID=46913 RepID=UPI000CE9858D|nr:MULTISPECIES: allophanate hydrolase subunit 1 [Devosia]AVF05265.1 allophanate hydrolase subunit 1 [Devosia sp. I507]